MNAEQLHNALNLVDSDLVATVDALRQRKRPATSRLPRWGMFAACLCVILLSSFLLRSSPIGSESTSTGDAPPNAGAGFAVDSADSKGNSPNASESLPISPSDCDAGGAASSGEIRPGSTTSASNTLVILVDSWQEGGFLGTIVSEMGDTLFSPGQQLLVLPGANPEIIGEDGTFFPYDDKIENLEECGFSVGSLLLVQFDSFEYNEITHSYDRIYAGSIAPYNDENA